jgi:hypothetical protein
LNLNDRELHFRRYGAIEQPDDIIVTGDHRSLEALALSYRCNDQISTSSDIGLPGFQGPSSELAITI